ncbi:hypothetical protein AVEN_159933-1 [Araneus ventricosus]|uniref:Uncharacterized protein n=1 Tax=Araneus ventricosus TaxID=182803 RepID=A0A4Y2N5A4_ARAVE|nr:hypothetical protein AVEN_159933-1 [Araneus ventricosus]
MGVQSSKALASMPNRLFHAAREYVIDIPDCIERSIGAVLQRDGDGYRGDPLSRGERIRFPGLREGQGCTWVYEVTPSPCPNVSAFA